MSKPTNTSIGGWINGDFNGDGKVDGSDYGLMDFTFSSQGDPIRPPTPVLAPAVIGKLRRNPGSSNRI